MKLIWHSNLDAQLKMLHELRMEMKDGTTKAVGWLKIANSTMQADHYSGAVNFPYEYPYRKTDYYQDPEKAKHEFVKAWVDSLEEIRHVFFEAGFYKSLDLAPITVDGKEFKNEQV